MRDRRLKEKLLLTVIATCALTALLFIIIAYYKKNYVQLSVDFTGLVGLLYIYHRVYNTGRTAYYGMALAFFVSLIISVVIYVNGSEAIYWLYPLIIVSFYLLPPTVASVTNIILVVFAFSVTYGEFSEYSLIRVFASLTLTNVFSLIFSKFLEKQNGSLKTSNRSSNLRNEVLEHALNTTELSTILVKVALAIEKELPDSICSVLLIDDSGKHLVLGAAPNLPKFYNDAVDGVAIGEGVGSCGNAAYTKQLTIVEDISTHPYWSTWVDLANKAGLNACWSEPLINYEGEVIGTFAIYHSKITKPTNEELHLISEYANLARIAIERKKLDRVVWKLAHYDSLTGLPNRNMLKSQIEKTLSDYSVNGKPFSLVILDLDNFKSINDSLGHEAGDFVLVESSMRIKDFIRKSDLFFRLGGDEFVIIITEVKSEFQTNKIGKKLLKILSEPYFYKGKAVFSTASMGIATYPDDANSIKSLLRNADQAMYEAKKKGKDKLCFFNESMSAAYIKRKEMISDLRDAIKNNEFFIHYQPIVCMHTSHINKAEALIRWNHPIKGIISPLDFIPLAEESGLIVDISNWVFNEVLKQVQHWRVTFESEMQVKINTSPLLYLNDGAILKEWIALLNDKGVSPKSIGIEITENLLMENLSEVSSVIDFMRMNEVEVSIDDFGTGYSSFSYLKEFNIDYIKIDKSFVQNISENDNDAALCEAIIVMAKKLDILIIAEGIETKDQLDRLKLFGCDFAQGYYFHRPLSKEKFECLLRKVIINS